MDFNQLSRFLQTLSLKQLKLICNKPRSWGVYNSSPMIAGYSKCKNKADLIAHILNYFSYYEQNIRWDNRTDRCYYPIYRYDYEDEKVIFTEIACKMERVM